MDELAFLHDQLVQDAVIRNFEIIGEASNNIEKHYPEFALAHPELPLAFAYKMRNAVGHGYFKVDFEIVWKTSRTLNAIGDGAIQLKDSLGDAGWRRTPVWASWDQWAPKDEQSHKAGPAVFGKIPIANQQAIKYNAAWLIGMNKATPDRTFRMQVEYEF